MSRNFLQLTFAVLASALCAASANAIPTQVSAVDDPLCCDILSVPINVHELGIGIAAAPFPLNERISATSQPISIFACPSNANPGTNSAEVFMTNLTGLSWSDVWYVSDDPDTRITNWDGFVNGSRAFKIDHVGINNPLLNESINVNGIFEPGEVWDFVIDGYQNNFFLPASALNSIGVGNLSLGDQISSGSIIAIQNTVPEPATCLMLASGLAGIVMRRRSTRGR